MKESAFWKKIRTGLLDVATSPIDLVRVENLVSLGVPDVNGCYKGTEFWIELKCGYNKRTPAQIVWAVSRSDAGGRVFLLHRKANGYVDLSFQHGKYLENAGGWGKINFPELLEILISYEPIASA